MNILADLFLTFAKIGCFTFGGGYAMIALIEDACVERKQWISHDDLMNVTVIAESTPGPIAINCATFVGYRQAGFSGALAATLGMILPSFLIIFAISHCLERFLAVTWIADAFQGIRLAVGILILDAGLTMLKKMRQKQEKMKKQGKMKKTKRFPWIMMAFGFLSMLAIHLFRLPVSTIALMTAAAAAGLIFERRAAE